MPYSTCCRKQNKPSEISRIANDLSNDGFDPEVHLTIAQETLRHLRDSLNDLPEIEREYTEALRGLSKSDSAMVNERMGKLAEEMKLLKEELRLAPDRVEEVENDIAMLKNHIANIKGNEHWKGSGTLNAKGGGKEDVAGDGRGNERMASAKEESATKVEKLEL